MTVKDKQTGKILNTNSLWLIKEWKKNPKRFLINFKTEDVKEVKEEKKNKKVSDK